jgi:anti-sigma regulatory factor (Ser/Thr protein kinase)
MEAFLIDEWLGTEDTIPIVDDASVSAARQRARDVASAQSMNAVEAERLATMASELAYNHLKHARRGQIAVRPIARGDHAGVEVTAADEGDGIADPTRAFLGVPRVTGSLGVGLAAVREHADEMDVDVRLREGTCVRARVFRGEAPRRREVGIFGRPYPDEPRSGDHASFVRDGERLLVAVCDGLGHGPPARDAAVAAIGVFAKQETAAPRTIIEECHRTLGPTRGAVMAVAAVGETSAPRLDIASMGNVTVELVSPFGGHGTRQPRSSRRFAASSFVLGSSQRGWRPHVEVAAIEPHETLLVYTDGITSRASIADDLALLREHPIIIAHQLVLRFARDNDDVLVLVAR